MQHLEFEPPDELREAIRCFWYNNREFGETQAAFEVVPDGYAEIIFHFGSGLQMAVNGHLQTLPSPFMMGLLNQPAVFFTQNRLQILAIRCYPWTVFDLLGLPADQEGVRKFDHPVAQLQSLLKHWIQAEKPEEAIAELKQFFLNNRPEVTPDPLLSKVATAMKEKGGRMKVNQVAARAHATVRTLERKFKQSSGHTVKDVSALMRFEQVRNRLWNDPKVNLAGLSQELGYADQSHLSKEFNRYSGSTPAAFAKKAMKGKQLIGHHVVYFTEP